MPVIASLAVLYVILLVALGAFIFYWIIRLAVRHGIRDARK
jgi:hypothetical protein